MATTLKPTTEFWKQIPKYPDYEASTAGRIRRIRDAVLIPTYLGSKGKKGRSCQVTLGCSNTNVKACVAMAFKPEEYHGVESIIFNIDDNPENNALENLRIVSAIKGKSEIHSKLAREQKPKRIKLSPDSVRQIREMAASGHGDTTIAKLFNIARSAIWAVRVGKRWSHVK